MRKKKILWLTEILDSYHLENSSSPEFTLFKTGCDRRGRKVSRLLKFLTIKKPNKVKWKLMLITA